LQKPIRIAFDCQKFCVQNRGGITKYFFNLALQFTRQKINIKVFAPFHCNAYLQKLHKSIQTGFYFPFYFASFQERIFWINLLISKILIHQHRPDIVHETYFSPYKTTPRGCKTVITVFDMIHDKFPNLYPKLSERKNKAKAIQKANHILCISESTKNDLIALQNVPAERITVTYLGVDKPANSVTKNMSERPLPEPYLLYVGNRGPHKNFSGLIRSLKIINSSQNFKIVVFGLFPFTTEEKELFKNEYIDTERIVFVSGDEEKLQRFYQHAVAHVVPSFYEGFGLTALEAMVCDCPVICSRTSSLPEVVGDAAEFFDPARPEDIASAISRVINQPSKRLEMIEKGRIQHKKFSWEKTAKETLQVYKKILA